MGIRYCRPAGGLKFAIVPICGTNVIKIGGGQEHFGLFLVDFIWNDPTQNFAIHTHTGVGLPWLPFDCPIICVQIPLTRACVYVYVHTRVISQMTIMGRPKVVRLSRLEVYGKHVL